MEDSCFSFLGPGDIVLLEYISWLPYAIDVAQPLLTLRCRGLEISRKSIIRALLRGESLLRVYCFAVTDQEREISAYYRCTSYLHVVSMDILILILSLTDMWSG